MAHCGSSRSTALNVFSDSGNQYECSIATAVSKACCTFGSHDVGKVTLPTRLRTLSSCAEAGNARSNATNSSRVFLMALLPGLEERPLYAKSHLLEEMRVDARHGERIVLALHLHVRLPAEVARDGRDRVHVHERRAMDLPEDFRVEAVEQFADRRLDERLGIRRHHARVFLVRLEKQHLGDREQAQGLSHRRLDPLHVPAL